MIVAKIRAFIIPKKVRLVEVEVKKQCDTRKLLDQRLAKIVEATLNGESEWFMEGKDND